MYVWARAFDSLAIPSQFTYIILIKCIRSKRYAMSGCCAPQTLQQFSRSDGLAPWLFCRMHTAFWTTMKAVMLLWPIYFIRRERILKPERCRSLIYWQRKHKFVIVNCDRNGLEIRYGMGVNEKQVFFAGPNIATKCFLFLLSAWR